MPPVRRKNSSVWSYFSVTDRLHQKAKCDLCGLLMSFRGTITNLRTHLKRKHPTNTLSQGIGYTTQVSVVVLLKIIRAHVFLLNPAPSSWPSPRLYRVAVAVASSNSKVIL